METKMLFVSAVIFCLQSTRLAYAASCNNGDKTGEDQLQNKDEAVDAGTDIGILLQANDAEFTFTCCGRITSWEIYAKNEGAVYLQVWRNTGGSTWELRGQNLYNVLSADVNSEVTVNIPSNEQILVNNGDVIGMYFPGIATISYKNEGGNGAAANNHGYYLENSIGSKTVGDSHTWSSPQVGRDYGITSFLSGTNSPSFAGHLTTVEFFDNLASGSLIKTITATDADTLDSLTFSMTTTTSSFTFDPSTLQLSSSGNLPSSSSTSTSTISFLVTDDCGNTDTGDLQIKVKNNPPIITNLPRTAEVSEDVKASTLLYTVTVTDSSPADTVTCSVTNISPTSADFSMGVGAGGIATRGIYVNANPTLRYDTNKRYDLTVTCSDTKDSDTGILSVFLTRNNAPSITNLPNGASVGISIAVTSGDTIYTVTGSDPEGDTLYYNMTCDQSTCPFAINSLTGIVTATSSLGSLTLPAYDLFVYIYDSKSLVGPRTLTIIVRDINVAPSFTNIPLSSPISITENTALGTLVYHVSSTDPNIQDTLTYSAVFTPNTAAGYFTFDGTTGKLTTASSILNYETLSTTTFTIAVTVTDGSASTVQNLVINIINVNEAPQFDRSAYSLSANEGQAGASVGDPGFVVTDPDGDSFTYRIDCAAFIMNSATGAVTFSADYDTDISGVSTTVICTVTVSDGSLTDSCQLVITIDDINDNTPTFSQPLYIFYISAVVGAGATVGSISASDADTGAYGVVSYSLNQSNLSQEYFGVQANGAMYVKQDISSFSSGHILTMTVTATDTGGLSDTCTVVVVIPEYSTTVYATQSERQITFLEDTRNVAWISVLGFTIFGTASLVLFLTYKAYRCGDFCRWLNESEPGKSHIKLRSDQITIEEE